MGTVRDLEMKPSYPSCAARSMRGRLGRRPASAASSVSRDQTSYVSNRCCSIHLPVRNPGFVWQNSDTLGPHDHKVAITIKPLLSLFDSNLVLVQLSREVLHA